MLMGIAIRRFTTIKSFLDCAKTSINPVLQKLDGFRPLEVDQTAKPLSSDRVFDRFRNLTSVEQAEIVGAISVACTNLGYALEHTLKLLVCLQTGEDRRWFGSEGHKLDKIFRELSAEMQNTLSTLFKGTTSHDFEFQELFNAKFKDVDEGSDDISTELPETLEYLHSRNLLQGARYKYSDAREGVIIHLFVPLRMLIFIESVVMKILAPKLGLTIR